MQHGMCYVPTVNDVTDLAPLADSCCEMATVLVELSNVYL